MGSMTLEARDVADVDVVQVWIGCLSCYNGGSFVGGWADLVEVGDAASDPFEFSGCVLPGHEEWHVGDVEDPYGVVAGALGREPGALFGADLRWLSDLLVELNDCAYTFADEVLPAMAAWLGLRGVTPGDEDPEDVVCEFQTVYRGRWGSFVEFAEEFAAGIGMFRDWPETARRYFDMDAWASDLEHDYWTVADGPDVFVFEPGAA